MTYKKCKKCGELKSIEDFFKCKGMKDGFRNECKKCGIKPDKVKAKIKRQSGEIKMEGEKICRICNTTKPIIEFHIKKGTPDGHRSECKECAKINYKKYSDAPGYKEKKKEYHKKRYDENREQNLEQKKEYHIKNREKILEKKKVYRNEPKNKEKIRNWRLNNLEKCADLQSKYRKKYPHIIAWRTILYSTLNRLGKEKESHTIDMLGYSALELKEHIEMQFISGMTWENHGEWHIDHIQPVISFDSQTDIKIVCALSNLRPLWATTREIDGVVHEGNLNKGSRKNIL